MSKFNLFESEYNLVRETVRPPPVISRRPAPRMTPVFVIGVALWFVAMFAVVNLVLLH
jgi:hypothetical protein